MRGEDSDAFSDILLELRRTNFLLLQVLKTHLGAIIESELQDKANETIYKMTGSKTVKQIATAVNISVGKVSQTWSRWEQLGIVYKDGKSYKKTLDS